MMASASTVLPRRVPAAQATDINPELIREVFIVFVDDIREIEKVCTYTGIVRHDKEKGGR